MQDEGLRCGAWGMGRLGMETEEFIAAEGIGAAHLPTVPILVPIVTGHPSPSPPFFH